LAAGYGFSFAAASLQPADSATARFDGADWPERQTGIAHIRHFVSRNTRDECHGRAHSIGSRFGANTVMKRPAQPEEIAPAYVFLAAPGCSSYITGEILPIIGGY